MPPERTGAHSPRRPATLYAGAAVLLLAAALRFWALDRLPGGLHFDLGANLLDVVDVLAGDRSAYFGRNNGREPLVIYLQALAAGALGPTPFAARLVTAFLGVLSVAALGFAARQLMLLADPARSARGRSEAVALLSAGALATTYWSVHFSRFGLRTAAVPALLALAFGLILRACRSWLGPAPPARPDRPWLCLTGAGLCLGAALTSYAGARLAAPALALPLAAAWLVDRRGRWIGGLAILALSSALVFAPLGRYYIAHPAAFVQHSRDTSVLRDTAAATDLAADVGRGLATTAAAFVWPGAGSPGAGENLPGRALLDPLQAALLLVGLTVVAGWPRRGRAASVAAAALGGWVVLLALPSALAVPSPGFVRLSGAVPAAALLVGIGADRALGWLAGAGHPLAARRSALLGAGLLLASTVSTAGDYFGRWAGEWAYRGAMADKADAAEWLAGQPQDARLFLAPLWATDFGVQFLTRARPIESFDTGGGAVVPTASAALYAYPYEDASGPEELRRLLPGAGPVEVVRDPSGRHTLLRVLRLPPGAVSAPEPRHRLEDGIGFVGAELPTLRRDDEPSRVTLRWLATARPSRDYTVFVQLRRGGATRAQHDGQPVNGTVATSRWRPGDLVVDRHDLRPPPELADAELRAYAGLYELSTGRRLRLLDPTGQPAAVDELDLGPLSRATH
jgi:hypothetical protein